MRTSTLIGNLAKALASAQGEFTNPGKTKTVTVRPSAGAAYSYNYAPMDEIAEMARPILAKHGLAWSSGPEMRGEVLIYTGRIMHAESGEWLETELPVPGGLDRPQMLGSVFTFFERYLFTKALLVTSEEDSDAAETTGHPHERSAKAPGSPQTRSAASPAPQAQPAAKAPTASLVNWRGKTRSEWGTLTNDAQTAQGDISTAQVRELLKLGEALKKTPPMLAREIQTNFAEGLLAAGCPTVTEAWQVDAPTAAEAIAWYRKATEQAKVPA